jgi:hypothetical protein
LVLVAQVGLRQALLAIMGAILEPLVELQLLELAAVT